MEPTRLQGLNAFRAKFEERNYEIICHEHEPAKDMETLKRVCTLEKAPYIKNLFYKYKKGEKGFAVVFARDETEIKKDYWKLLNRTYNGCRMGSADDLKEVLECYPGCVNPLSVINDADNKILNIIADKTLEEAEWLGFHPGDNTATIEIKRTDFEAFLKEHDRTVQYLDLSVEGVEKEAKKPQKGKKGKKPNKKAAEGAEEKENLLKIMYKKEEDFAGWYTEVIKKGNMIDYYDVSGCYVLKPNSYHIWEQIQKFLDARFKECGTRNCYFPMFVSKDKLEKEQDHVEGFKAEVAWVTKAGDSDIANPIAIRPTSETIIYPYFAKWIRSHRDLPMIVNQWSNVVRWEFSNPTPFIRTREFLWQEGHTAHATVEEADKQALYILDAYTRCYKEVLSIPAIPGKKSNMEKFPGGDWTYTCEVFSHVNGRSIQACTSHMLGQNFAKMFNVRYEAKKADGDDPNKKMKHVWQTSWGLSTRSIGALILVHSDNKGLVLTPAVATEQVVIVPIYMKNKLDMINDEAYALRDRLCKAGIRAGIDARDNLSPGFRYNETEIRGVPLRIEFGPRDIANKQCVLVRRFDGVKKTVALEGLEAAIQAEFESIAEDMYNSALEKMEAKRKIAHDWETFMEHLNNGCMILTPWCDEDEAEAKVRQLSAEQSQVNEAEGDSGMTGKAKTLCKPLEQPELTADTKCFFTGKEAKCWVYWGRSY